MKQIRKTIFFVILILFVTSFTTFAGELLVHFLDVGQADSIFVELPDGQTMLIDAGNNADGPPVVNYLKVRGVTTINYLIGTHPHEDHIGGLDDVIKSFDIGRVYMPKITHTTKTFEDVLLAVKNKGMKITPAWTGMVLFKEDNLIGQILSPISKDYEKLNNWSVVIRIDYSNTSFLFMGDAEHRVEAEMMELKMTPLKADVLKVGHHGSSSSTSEAFLKAVSPKYAVISVGKDNDYGHPSPVVLNRLYEHGVMVLRTDELGTIKCYSDGKTIRFNKVVKKIEPVNEGTSAGVQIINVDLKKEIVVIENKGGKSVDLSRWRLLSVKGSQDFFFPAGTTLNPGEQVIIASGRNAEAGPGVIVWTKAYIWNNDGDPAELYNDEGKLVSNF